jgi:hypothetical protein
MSDNPFTDSPISRRQFVRLSAATGGALALPGQASADVSSSAFDAEYEYLLNHTPDDYAVPTLVTFEDVGSLRAMSSSGPSNSATERYRSSGRCCRKPISRTSTPSGCVTTRRRTSATS